MGSSSSELTSITMKAFISSLLVATAMAAPANVGYAPVPAPYAPAPAPYAPAPYHPAPAPYHEEKIPPQPFAYEYGGADEYGRHFAKTETQDEHGVVKGEYRVELPDGRVQIVSYHADHENGFIADVRYEGEAVPYVAEPVHHAVHAAPHHAVAHAPVVAHAAHHAPVVAHAAPLVAHAPVVAPHHAVAHHAPLVAHAPVAAHFAHAPVATVVG